SNYLMSLDDFYPHLVQMLLKLSIFMMKKWGIQFTQESCLLFLLSFLQQHIISTISVMRLRMIV
ncbi:hypothetical protein, partial [[Clostridium] innocuum]|uniref:hypothetical protein n=1 Tax=Clostridium innocuum TaxID=1522 RepID=UPI001E48D58C